MVGTSWRIQESIVEVWAEYNEFSECDDAKLR